MRAIILVVLMLIGSASGSGIVLAADPPAAGGGGTVPVMLAIGEVRPIGRTADVVSPVKNPICDDVRIATVVDTPEGPAFRGVSAGKTLCSVSGGAVGVRQLFEITVR